MAFGFLTIAITTSVFTLYKNESENESAFHCSPGVARDCRNLGQLFVKGVPFAVISYGTNGFVLEETEVTLKLPLVFADFENEMEEKAFYPFASVHPLSLIINLIIWSSVAYFIIGLSTKKNENNENHRH